jgi:hypothetical protein
MYEKSVYIDTKVSSEKGIVFFATKYFWLNDEYNICVRLQHGVALPHRDNRQMSHYVLHCESHDKT